MDRKRNLTPLYLLINVGILIIVIVMNPEIKNIGQVLGNMNYLWVMISVGFMFIFWILDSIIIRRIMRLTLGNSIGFFDLFTINLIGRYYASLIPLGGGQAAQIVYLSKRGIPPGKSSSMLMMKFWIYQAALAIYAVFTFALKGGTIRQYKPYMFVAGIFGFLVNIVGPLMLYILSSKEGLINSIVEGVIGFFGSKGKRDKKPKLAEKITKFADDYSRAISLIGENKEGFSVSFLLSFIQVGVLYAIPYLIYRGCGLKEAGVIDIMLTNIFLHFSVCFVPTPGAAGATEGAFFSLFSLYFPKDLILIAMLFWRFISFYLTLLVGGAMVFIERLKAKSV